MRAARVEHLFFLENKRKINNKEAAVINGN
jgi:hypothetical protein